MEHSEFVSVYRRGTEVAYSPNNILRQAEYWDSFFGKVVYDFLKTGISGELEEPVNDYWQWDEADFYPYVWKALSSETDQQFITNKHNFHLLNGNMLYEWGAMTEEKPLRQHLITGQQDRLAHTAMRLYHHREKLFNSQAHQGGKSSEHYDKIEGMLAEFDVAMVLLEIKKRHPEITNIVASPRQFETASESYNSDFLALTASSVTGVQVKSRVYPEDYKKVDKSRLIFVDSSLDLGNVLAKKIPGYAAKKVMSWGGIVCAQHLHRIDTRGRGEYSRHLTQEQRNKIINAKFMAKHVVPPLKSNFQAAVGRIEERLLNAL